MFSIVGNDDDGWTVVAKSETTNGFRSYADAVNWANARYGGEIRRRQHLAAFMGDCKVPSCDVCRPLSPFVRNALANRLPAKVTAY